MNIVVGAELAGNIVVEVASAVSGNAIDRSSFLLFPVIHDISTEISGSFDVFHG